MTSNPLRWIVSSAALLLSYQAGAGGYQAVEPTAAALSASRGAEVVVAATYTTSDADPTLTGLGLRIHFDSTALSWGGFDRLLQNSLIGADTEPVVDTTDLDGDPRTDVYVTVAWADPAGAWPGALGTELLAARFEAIGSGATRVRFSASATAAGYGFRSGSAKIRLRR